MATYFAENANDILFIQIQPDFRNGSPSRGSFFATRRLEREQCFFSHASNFSRVQKSKGQFTRCDLSATINRKAKRFMYSASTAHAFFIVKLFFIKRLGKQNGR